MILVTLWSLWLGRRAVAYRARVLGYHRTGGILTAGVAYRARVLGLLTVLWIGITAGLVSLGLLEFGAINVVALSFVAVLFLDGRWVWGLIAGNILSLIVVGVAATRHWFDFDIDFPRYAYHPLAWTNLIYTLCSYALIVALLGRRLLNWLLDRERAVRQERDLKQQYLDAMQTLMVSLDPTGHVIMINRKGGELLGRDAGELLGRHWFQQCVPQPLGLDTLYPRFLGIMRGAEAPIHDDESSIVRRDGEQRLIAWLHAYLADDQGRALGVLSSGMDITERKQTEIRLRLAASVFTHAREAILISDADGRIVEVNEAGVGMTGYSCAELIG